MKRVIEFKASEMDYSFVENGEKIFGISKRDLKFDVKEFYQVFFANGQDYSVIELRATDDMDKMAKHVYETVHQLFIEICERLKEETAESEV